MVFGRSMQINNHIPFLEMDRVWEDDCEDIINKKGYVGQ